MICIKCLSRNVTQFIDGGKLYRYCLHCFHSEVYDSEFVHACPKEKDADNLCGQLLRDDDEKM